MNKKEGIALAKALKQELKRRHIPVRQVMLFGSTARGETHRWSDVDIAVICDPFKQTRLEEDVEVSKARWGIDLRIETICLHQDDMENAYSIIGQEVRKHGIPV